MDPETKFSQVGKTILESNGLGKHCVHCMACGVAETELLGSLGDGKVF